MPRPKKENQNKRDATIWVRVTQSEKELLDSTANERGLPTSQYVRLAALDQAKRDKE